MKQLLGIVLLVATIGFSSCQKQDEIDESIIQQYITDNNLTAIEGEEGLYYTLDVVGTGASPNLNSSIKLNYTGYYTDGVQFDATNGSPVTFPLASLILGWKYGLQHFKEGGKGKLLIPSALGYGSTPPTGVRANAVLVFDIDLIDVQ
jgi:FKBP-type peptidyl-prolyl cis-trans isomerase